MTMSFPVTLPSPLPVSSGYGKRKLSTTGGSTTFHYGIDQPYPNNSPIIACGDGVIHCTGYNATYGWWTCVDHGRDAFGRQTYMRAHACAGPALLPKGAPVKPGDVIARSGDSGIYTTGYHCHTALLLGGHVPEKHHVDPLAHLSYQPTAIAAARATTFDNTIPDPPSEEADDIMMFFEQNQTKDGKTFQIIAIVGGGVKNGVRLIHPHDRSEWERFKSLHNSYVNKLKANGAKHIPDMIDDRSILSIDAVGFQSILDTYANGKVDDLSISQLDVTPLTAAVKAAAESVMSELREDPGFTIDAFVAAVGAKLMAPPA